MHGSWGPGAVLKWKCSPCQYRMSHYKDKVVWQLAYLNSGNPYTWKDDLHIYPSHIYHNASDKYTTMHYSVTEMCSCVHISVRKWCILRYGTGALWDFLDGFIETALAPNIVRSSAGMISIAHVQHINGLVQERRNSIANALELRLSCTNLLISSLSWGRMVTTWATSIFRKWCKNVSTMKSILVPVVVWLPPHPGTDASESEGRLHLYDGSWWSPQSQTQCLKNKEKRKDKILIKIYNVWQYQYFKLDQYHVVMPWLLQIC